MNNNTIRKDRYYQLASDLAIHRVINGMWQVTGGHGHINHELAIKDMMKYHDYGFTSLDLTDIYGPAEDFIGQFRRKLSELKGKEELDRIQALTKLVPQLERITHYIVKENIQRSLHRMGIDLLICSSFTGGIIIILSTWNLSNICLIFMMKE